MADLSLCMIVKDEARCLARCLQSVAHLVDEIIVVDTGSIDESVNIAQSFGARVEYFKWCSDFSQARNYALSFATKSWILVLDADEYLLAEDDEKLCQVIQHPTAKSYYLQIENQVLETAMTQLVSSLVCRLFKNIPGIRYEGAIHEQLVMPQIKSDLKEVEILDVRLLHDGYIESVKKEKNKGKRNRQIIESILDETPHKAFHLFNLGTEYMVEKEFEEALACYDQSYELLNTKDGYVSKLVLYRIICLVSLTQYKRALKAIDEGLSWYPQYTDLMYQKGEVERLMHQPIKAIKSYEQCLVLGEPPIFLKCTNTVYSSFPLLRLISLYESLNDDEMALSYYKRYFQLDDANPSFLNDFIRCLKRLGYGETIICQTLMVYLNVQDYHSSLLYLRLLFQNHYIETFRESLSLLSPTSETFYFFSGILALYELRYDEATHRFEQIQVQNMPMNITSYRFVLSLLTNKRLETTSRLYELIWCLSHEQECDIMLTAKEEATLFELLEICIQLNNFQLFETLLEALNYVESEDVLLKLAQLYDTYGFYTLAIQEIKRSVVYFNKLNEESAKILYKSCPLLVS